MLILHDLYIMLVLLFSYQQCTGYWSFKLESDVHHCLIVRVQLLHSNKKHNNDKQLSFTVKNPLLQLVKIDCVISVYLSLQ